MIAGNQWNYAAYKPYYQNRGPRYFCYTPHPTMDMWNTLNTMAREDRCMAIQKPIHAISNKDWKRIVKAYRFPYEQGRWLTKSERRYLSFMRKAVL